MHYGSKVVDRNSLCLEKILPTDKKLYRPSYKILIFNINITDKYYCQNVLSEYYCQKCFFQKTKSDEKFSPNFLCLAKSQTLFEPNSTIK